MIKELHITVGLPASGKSTWAETKMEEWKSLDLPRVLRCVDRQDINRAIVDMSCSFNRDYYAILDGLFLTNDDVLGILEIFKQYNSEIEKVTINYWKEDKENCLRNDKIRGRKLTSKATIMKAQFDTMDLNYLIENSPYKNIEVVEREVYQVTEFDEFSQDLLGYFNTEGSKVKLESWSLGGSHGSCWNDSMATSSPDEQPEPDRFDEIVEKLFGEDISMKKYKEIKSECLSIETEYETEYYGGYSETAYYVLDMDRLYEIYKEEN
jgi:hypothetical protein